MLGETGHSNLEIVAVMFADVSDEVDAMDESSLSYSPFFLTSRRISS